MKERGDPRPPTFILGHFYGHFYRLLPVAYPLKDAIKDFKSLLSMQNKFGVEEHGFSSPSKLFTHKDLKEDLSKYQFDLKNDDQYFYVILREIEDFNQDFEGCEETSEKTSTSDEDCDDVETEDTVIANPKAGFQINA